MKNSKNKVVAGVVCGIIMGSIGTSFIGNFQSNEQVSVMANTHDNDYRNNENNNDNSYEYSRPGKGKGHHRGQGSTTTTDSIDIANGNYSDGTYEGSATGYGGNISVQVSISDGKISTIDITSHSETPGFYETAFESVPQNIISKQSTDVDTVSGATYSSVGIINAVNDALSDSSSNLSSDKTI